MRGDTALGLVRVLLIGAVVATSAGACSSGEPESERARQVTEAQPEALRSARSLARVDPVLSEMLGLAQHGWRLDGASFRARDASAADVFALGGNLALSADGLLEIGRGTSDRLRLGLRALGAAPSAGVESDGHVTFRDVWASTDLVVSAAPRRIEQLLLLHDPRAPRKFEWSIELGAGLKEGILVPGEGLRFVDTNGHGVMRIPPAYALDRGGRRRDASMTWDGSRLSVELDTKGLEFPVLLDPAVESYVWVKALASAPAGLDNRVAAAMAFDSRPARNVAVHFGGMKSDASQPGDTWEWNGTTWTKKCEPCGPAGRIGPAMAFHDAATKFIVLFGGKVSALAVGDTWHYDGTTWSAQCTSCVAGTTRPADRSFHAMAYVPGYGTLLFGGLPNGPRLDDTWVWSGSAWTQKCTTCTTGVDKPSARSSHAMAYDAAHDKVVLFGGGSPVNNETWLFDKTTEKWSKACTACVTGVSQPAARSDHAMAYDSRRGKVVLFGGYSGSTDLKDTWEWDGNTWSKTDESSQAPAIRNGHSMTFDQNRGRTVLFGGTTSGVFTGDTWEYHARGGACSVAAQCDTGYCVDGVCCETSSCPACQSCDLATPGQCSGIVNADDPSGCTGANTCDATGSCKKKAGQGCSAGSECALGICVDGTCCINNCTTECRSCANSSGTCTTLVTNQDDSTCTGANTCDGAGVCKKKNGQGCSVGADCASGNCVDGTCCADACTTPCRSCANSSGSCTTLVTNQEDGTACNNNNSCDGSGNCKKKNGQGCSAGSECVSGNCADGYCCNAACTGGCDVCSQAAGAPQNGVCTVLGAGTVAAACDKYKCGGAADCPTTCSSDAGCVDGNYCAGNACVPKKGLGVACSAGNECVTGTCADGVCCETSCTGKCMACAAANKEDQTPANSGKCGAAKKGTNPGGQCVSSTDPCGDQASCSGAPGACSKGAAGTSCGPTTCTNGAVTGKVCNGSGLCIDQTNAQCSPYVCKGSACSSPCGADTDCVTDYYCSNGVCVAKSDNGKGCSSANTCKSGFCVDSVCCDGPCSGQCQACAEIGSVGQCKVVSGDPRAPRPACVGTTGDKCKGTCDGANPNACTYPAAGTACKDASCTGDVTQPAGSCDGAGLCSVPATKNCLPYGCNATTGACYATCSSDAECAQGSKCDTSQGKCAVSAATCKDATTVIQPNGQEVSCVPYKCLAGACQQQCSQSSDCASGYVCQGTACVAEEAGTDAGSGGTSGSGGAASGGTSTGGASTGGSSSGGASTGGAASGGKKGQSSGDDGGCGCRVPGRRPPAGAGWLGLALLAAVGRSMARRRRAPQAG